MMRVKGEQNVAAVRGLGSNSTQRYIEVHKRQLLEEIVAWKKKMYAVLKSNAVLLNAVTPNLFGSLRLTHTVLRPWKTPHIL